MLSPLVTNTYESELLDLIDNSDDYTRSDLQAVVTVLVNSIMKAGIQAVFKAKGSLKFNQ